MTVELSTALAEIYEPTTVNAATYTIQQSDKILDVRYTDTGTVAIEIPSTFATGNWAPIVIKDGGGGAGTYNITISTEGSETIDGDATYVLASNYDSINIYTDGTNYFIW